MLKYIQLMVLLTLCNVTFLDANIPLKIFSNNPLEILFVVDFFPKRTETFILNQITSLIDRGHNIWIHSYNYVRNSKLCSVIKKYKLLKRTSYGRICPHNLNSFDILYCQFGTVANKMLKQKKQQKSKTKLVTCFRGYDITRQLQKFAKTYDALLKEGDFFLPVCDLFAQKLISLGADPSKVLTHHSAIDCLKFPYQYTSPSFKKTINIVSVSRLIEKKGIEDALYTISLVVKKYPMVHYSIVGEGYLKAKLQLLVHKLGIQKYVTFLGDIPHEQITSILQKAHIFILPSIKTPKGEQEGIPNAIKEAMACGIPIISTYHAGIPELVEHGYSGLLSPEGDINDLAQNICSLIENPELCVMMGKHGRRKIEQDFNLDVLIPRLEDIFYTLLNA